ncbi:MAG: hypothetical protein ACHQC8_02695 [Solirubrobacterales bacterium]
MNDLDCCADCRGWLLEHSVRVAGNWEWWFVHRLENGIEPPQEWGCDAAEADDLRYYLELCR